MGGKDCTQEVLSGFSKDSTRNMNRDYSCDTMINNLSTPKLCGTLSLINLTE